MIFAKIVAGEPLRLRRPKGAKHHLQTLFSVGLQGALSVSGDRKWLYWSQVQGFTSALQGALSVGGDRKLIYTISTTRCRTIAGSTLRWGRPKVWATARPRRGNVAIAGSTLRWGRPKVEDCLGHLQGKKSC